jgi:hypothetical protein
VRKVRRVVVPLQPWHIQRDGPLVTDDKSVAGYTPLGPYRCNPRGGRRYNEVFRAIQYAVMSPLKISHRFIPLVVSQSITSTGIRPSGHQKLSFPSSKISNMRYACL